MSKKSEIPTAPDAYCLSGSSPPLAQTKNLSRVATLILAFLRAQLSPVAEKKILKTVKARKQTKVREIRWLIINGYIERFGSGTKSNPYLYQTLTPVPKRNPCSNDQEGGEEISL